MLFLGFFCYILKAQISTEEIPYSWAMGNEKVTQQIPMERMPNLDMKSIEQEDLKNTDFQVSPIRFGYPHDVNLDLFNSGVWQATPDGGRLWSLKIYSPDALSLNLLYDKFWLPDGAKFFIYSEDKKQHIGAFTSENNIGDNDIIMGFATGFLFTNSIVLEYYEPKGTEDGGIISISQIISGYRYIYDIVGRENQLRHNNTDYTCHNDVNCLVGYNYEDEKNAVAYMVMGMYICTGALLNTTANDNRPVFLSADHCFNTSASTTQWIFYWNYEAPCGSVVNPSFIKSTVGANILARRAESDFMLLNLIENPAMNPNISVYYLGWDRTTTAATRGVGIHHPKGAQKKISITTKSINNYPSSINWKDAYGNTISTTPANTHWKVDFTNGTAEGGSSGSPILNQNRRVIGQLHGGTSGCPPNVSKYYGRFDVSWNGGGTSSTRLKDWLDPIGANVMALDGKDIKPFISGPNTICPSGTYSVVNGTATSSWSITPSNLFSIGLNRSINPPTTTATVTSYNIAGASGVLTTITGEGITITKNIQSCQASISGPDILCSGSTYTLSGIPSNLAITNVNWSSSQGIALSFPTTQSSVVASNLLFMPLITATYPLPDLFTVPLYGTITATVRINNVSSVLSKNLTLFYPSGSIIGPMNINGQHVVMPTQPGYYKFTVGADVPSTANVRWVSAPVNSSDPNATADLHLGRTVNIYLHRGRNEIRMQYEDGCNRSIPTVMLVDGGPILSPPADTTNFIMDAEALSNELVAQLSPNPVGNAMNVTVENATEPILVTVYSSSGTMYLSQTFSTPTFTMDLSRCQPGMLVVRISCGDKYVIKNILKQ